MLDVFLTFRLHPGAFGWGRLLTEEVVLSGYKVPPGVSTTQAQGLRTCSLFISFTLIFALTTCFLARLSVCLFLTLFICLPECLFNSIAPFVCLMLPVSLMVCLSASRSFCLSFHRFSSILAGRVVIGVIKLGNNLRKNPAVGVTKN